MRLYPQGEVKIAEFNIDLLQKKIVHGLPKHISRLRILIDINSSQKTKT